MSAAVAILLHVLLLFASPPLFLGVIQRVKARAVGRKGPPLLQPYHDLLRLLRKGAVYSTTTTWVFVAGPIVALASIACAGFVLPLASIDAPIGFAGDVILFAYLLGLARFAIIAAALDTGSSFEGMGASREAAFSALAEPALFLSLAILCIPSRSAGFAEAFLALPSSWGFGHPSYLAAVVALFAVLLAECSRVPVDDPNTDLELTMIHEVMVLDHSGPDLAFIQYGGAMKMFVIGGLLVHVMLPIPPQLGVLGIGLFLLGQLLVAVCVGVVESFFARVRLARVPQFLVGASVVAAIGLAALFYRGQP